MRLRVYLAGVLVVGLAAAGFATEGGGGAYPNGAEGFMVGAVPPPGQYLINYMLYYNAGRFLDGSGNEILDPSTGAVEPFDVEVYAEVLRLINVTKFQVLGASWLQHIFIIAMYEDVDPPAAGVPSDSATGMGDIIVDPFILAWHTENVHVGAGLDVYLPVGKYDKNDVANLGRGYWTFEPVVVGTYRDKRGIEVSAKVMYDINLENNDTHYDSGDEFHFDYTVAKYFGALGVGIGGYYYKQVTDDKGLIVVSTALDPIDAESDAFDGFKGQGWAWGPQISYQLGKMNFALKYQHEEDVEFKSEGDRFWFKFVTSF